MKTSKSREGEDRGRGPRSGPGLTLLDSLPVELTLSMDARDADDELLVREVADAIADCDALTLIEKPTVEWFTDGTDNRAVTAWVRTFGCTPEHALDEVTSRLLRCWGASAGRVYA